MIETLVAKGLITLLKKQLRLYEFICNMQIYIFDLHILDFPILDFIILQYVDFSMYPQGVSHSFSIKNVFYDKLDLTLSRRRPLSYRNQSIDLLRKSMDWFLYDNGLCLERVKIFFIFIWRYILMHGNCNEVSLNSQRLDEKSLICYMYMYMLLSSENNHLITIKLQRHLKMLSWYKSIH